MPELARGKGNKLINIPTGAFNSGEETMIAVAAMSQSDQLIVRTGARHLRLKVKDLEHYIGERARRGRDAAARISEGRRRRGRVFLSP